MLQVYPERREVALADLAPDYLAQQIPRAVDVPFIRAMMIASIDGAVRGSTGTSIDLTTDEDLAMLTMLRACADAVLVGAATARAYPYRVPKAQQSWLQMRRDAGMSDAPRLVIVTRNGLASDNACFENPANRPIIVVPRTCPMLKELNSRAEVIVAGDEDVDMMAMVKQLHTAGIKRIVCEGGPTLLSAMSAQALIDEYCLTTAPMWFGVAELPLSGGLTAPLARTFDLNRLIVGRDSYLFAQWRARHAKSR